MMKKIIFILITMVFLNYFDILGQSHKNGDRSRIIATTDGEIDDQCSMVRFLMYANEWDIEGIILSSSKFHWVGHRWAGTNWIDPYFSAYSKVYPNLIKHDKGFPTPDYLRSHIFIGNIDSVGEMEKVTPGSEFIAKVLLDTNDNRPVWIQAWGGPNTIARALKTIEEKHPEMIDYVAMKAKLYLIWEQDNTYDAYIYPIWVKKRGLEVIISDEFTVIAYQWKKKLPQYYRTFFEPQWMNTHILKEHGALTGLYRAHDDGAFRSEGDSPSFFHQIDVGLRNLENPAWGGWGGRFAPTVPHEWRDTDDNDGKGNKYEYFSQYRWIDVIQNDWAARADWCIKDYNQANHPPKVRVSGKLDRSVKPGQFVELNASKCHDPDNDQLSYKWWQYKEPGSYNGSVDIKNLTKSKSTILIPENAEKGETIHIILEVSDNGKPNLTRYARFILTVK